MPNRHRYPAAVIRPEPELYARAKKAVAAVGSDINTHVVEFLRYLVGDTDQIPERPAPSDGTSRPDSQ